MNTKSMSKLKTQLKIKPYRPIYQGSVSGDTCKYQPICAKDNLSFFNEPSRLTVKNAILVGYIRRIVDI